MECRREKAYSFSYCLFAYLYKDFDSKFKLPIPIDYVVPTTKLFTQAIAKYVLNISEIFKPHVKPVITKLYPQICSSEERFFVLVKWYDNTVLKNFSLKYKQLNDKKLLILSDDDVIALHFLILCSFIMELVVHSFENKCFFLISSGPTCLAELLLTFSDTFTDFYTLYILKIFCEDSTSIIDRITLLNLTLMFKDIVKFMDSNLSDSKIVNISNASLEINSLTCGSSSDLQYISTIDPVDYLIKQKNSTKRKINFENSVISSDKRAKTLFKEEDVTEFDITFEIDSSYCTVDEFKPSDISLNSRFTFHLCSCCNEECITYLEEFVDDFKETNYECD